MQLNEAVTFHDDEATMSFASRLAFANDIPTIFELLGDAQLSIVALLKGNLEISTPLTTVQSGKFSKLSD